jgi:hypothetical protein
VTNVTNITCIALTFAPKPWHLLEKQLQHNNSLSQPHLSERNISNFTGKKMKTADVLELLTSAGTVNHEVAQKSPECNTGIWVTCNGAGSRGTSDKMIV